MSKDLLDLISKSKAATSLLSRKGNFVVDDTIGVSLLFASCFKEKPGNYLLVTSNLYNAQKVADMIASLIGDENVLLFPVDDILRCELVSASKELLSQRLYVLNEALKANNKIIVAHATSLSTPLPTPEEFVRSSINIEVGKSYNLTELKEKLSQSGYGQVNKIDQSLEFASRGDILDVFSVNYLNPIRIEFFGDEVESISLFEIGTQQSYTKLNKIEILPANDCLFSNEEISKFHEKIDQQIQKDGELLDTDTFEMLKQTCSLDFDRIQERIYHPRMYKYMSI